MKRGAQAPGSGKQMFFAARETGDSAVAHYAGLKELIDKDPGPCAPGFML